MIIALKRDGVVHAGWTSGGLKEEKMSTVDVLKNHLETVRFIPYQDSYVVLDVEPSRNVVPLAFHIMKDYLTDLNGKDITADSLIHDFMPSYIKHLKRLKMLETPEEDRNDRFPQNPSLSLIYKDHIFVINAFRRVMDVESFYGWGPAPFMAMKNYIERGRSPKEIVLGVDNGPYGSDIRYVYDNAYIYFKGGDKEVVGHAPYREEEIISMEELVCR